MSLQESGPDITTEPEAMRREDPRQAQLRLVDQAHRRPLTERAGVAVRRLDRKGAQLELQTPFIHGCHILMDVHNTFAKLVEVFFPGENPETQEDLCLVGKVETYLREERDGQALFLAEVRWVEPPSSHGRDAAALKRQMRLISQAAKRRQR